MEERTSLAMPPAVEYSFSSRLENMAPSYKGILQISTFSAYIAGIRIHAGMVIVHSVAVWLIHVTPNNTKTKL